MKYSSTKRSTRAQAPRRSASSRVGCTRHEAPMPSLRKTTSQKPTACQPRRPVLSERAVSTGSTGAPARMSFSRLSGTGGPAMKCVATMPRSADRLTRERRLFDAAPNGPLSVCLVYPNTYPVGMANLGFQAVLRILAADPRVTCERAFLPDGPRAEWPRTLRSLERDRPVRDFDVVAFSISFEADYVHLLDCLALAGIPLWRDERTAA